MGFKKYIVFSIIFIVAIYGYAFSLELGDYKITVLDISVNLPVAVWLIVPIVLLFLATIGHILFYGLINIFKTRAIRKDHETMIDLLKANLLGKNSNKKFKTQGFKSLSKILTQFNFTVKDETFSSTDEELNKIVAYVQDIRNGKFISDKSFKLSETSELANLNLLNKINEQVDFAVEVVKKSENYPVNVVKHAFDNVLTNKTMTTVKKLYKNIKLDKELAKKLFEKDAANNEFGFTTEEIIKIVKDLDYKSQDYMMLAKNYETILQPDQIIALFEKLSNELETATPAYLHVLCEYEMIEKVKEIVSATSDDEYTAFKALLDLKDAGKQYNLESLSYK
ncbi:hypothetical protein GCM10012288_18710 [Malaciobacter pacificus]|uniref:Putative membrane protein n=1 Tax=Malaciobacter pacificus TaxID=1080223 RepID=A0A5C2H5K2_9BACT|nr:hypothetical protein [Malaciobacter pacificus]QEP33649.1 putative membrane protein [Malaciobacter pacificus]GGD44656.1 hypothetical protein GCM10012288_18710 [Malaciobacter pacificus]